MSISHTAKLPDYPTPVRWWVLLGLIMVLGQVFIGGITRLTGSGLSITRWEIVTGTIPPLNDQDWDLEFDAYKATPQYQKINAGMSMSEFKFIYFWEYFHRLWARLMGFVFIIPFIIFRRKKWLDELLLKRLMITVLMAAVVASFGWIMVASGLIDRPWVNAYKLTMHLSLACILYAYLAWTVFKVWMPGLTIDNVSPSLRKYLGFVIVLVAVQIILGGIMSGTKAALFYPTWPDMNGEWLPSVLTDASMWVPDNFVQYDATLFLPALVQFVHRSTAYLLTVAIVLFAYLLYKNTSNLLLRRATIITLLLLCVQVALGIATVMTSIGTIPVGLGVFHQAGGLLLLTATLYLYFLLGGFTTTKTPYSR
jgi:cytochrome c oxidase assembly protein subunit 15